MHLESLTIKNFRLLEDVEVKKLGHVNLIVGKNNSGKSTVLEALALLASGFDPDMVGRVVDNRILNRHLSEGEKHEKKSIILKDFLSIHNTNKVINRQFYIGEHRNNITVNYVYFIEEEKVIEDGDNFSITTTHKVLSPNEAERYEFLHNKKPLNGIQVTTSKLKSKTVNLDTDFFELEYTLATKPVLPLGLIETANLSLQSLTSSWDKIALTDDELLVVEALKIIDSRIQNLAFLSDNNVFDSDDFEVTRAPYIKLKDVEGRVPLHRMGDGIFRVLQIILTIFKARDGFLLIDEFENGLHYSVQPEVWRLIFELAKRFNIQVFATTHSWDCIESFAQVAKEREDLDGVLFRMGRSARKSDKGKVIATVYDEDELYYITKAKMEVR